MRVLVLSKYGALAASTRYRFLQFFGDLGQAGVECEVSPLLPDEYLRALYERRRYGFFNLVACYWRRLAVLSKVRRFDLVVIHCDALPFVPRAYEVALRLLAVPFILDLDDAVYLNYSAHRHWFVRRALSGKIAYTMRTAARTHCGSPELFNYCTQVGGKPVMLPTVVYPEHYPKDRPGFDELPFRVLWLGTPSTSSYLRGIEEALFQFCTAHEVEITLVGGDENARFKFPCKIVSWSEETEREELRRSHVGIMPLDDDAWARGKCGFKLVQYMAAALPVVASPIGANNSIVRHGQNGFLARNAREWIECLSTLQKDRNLCQSMGKYGRLLVESELSARSVMPVMLDSFREAASISR